MSILPPSPNAFTNAITPIPNITPFTYRDGLTYLEVLSDLRTYITDTLVPYLDTVVATLDSAWQEQMAVLLAQVNNLIAAQNAEFDEIVQQIINDSIQVQDPVVMALVNDENSATGAALRAIFATIDDLTTLAGTVTGVSDRVTDLETLTDSGRLSDATLDAQFTLKADNTYVDSQDALKADKSTQTTVETGRLSVVTMDDTWVKKPKNVHAVFIGSSNAAAGTWPETLCARQGWVCKNFTISGGGFTTTADRSFETQINAAISDNSYDHTLVQYVFIADAGNDIRAVNSVAAAAPPVFSAAKAAFPNARVIMLPALWGQATDNQTPARRRSVTDRVRELKEAALQYNTEFIDYSWTWHWDSTVWMLPAEVHYTPAGYTRVIYFVEKYLNNQNTDNPSAWIIATDRAAVNAGTTTVKARRVEDLVRVEGTFSTSGATAVDAELCLLNVGVGPIDTVRVPAINVLTRAVAGVVDIFPNGLIRANSTLTASTFYIESSYTAF